MCYPKRSAIVLLVAAPFEVVVLTITENHDASLQGAPRQNYPTGVPIFLRLEPTYFPYSTKCQEVGFPIIKLSGYRVFSEAYFRVLVLGNYVTDQGSVALSVG